MTTVISKILRTSRTLKLNKAFVFAVDFKMLPIREPAPLLEWGIPWKNPALGLASFTGLGTIKRLPRDCVDALGRT